MCLIEFSFQKSRSRKLNRVNFLSVQRLARLGWWIILLNSGISLILGLLAALFGGSLTALGNGAGGWNGIPDFVFSIPILLGLAGLFRGVTQRGEGQARWVLVFIGPLLISFGYLLIAHTFDPCLNGMWDIRSRIGETIPLCERFGSGINVHTRFHYLWHILPTLPLVWIYGRALKKQLPEVVDTKKK
ncbi:MAG: hypothetical protein H8E29_15010 [Anaerolineales bacterium]|uniref:Uncharacterized protein n=1 Tax=Candidatus Desulfolinea nitratireducens TaxID=2841698 RepID=A0A8J6TJK3_9CHLR|nr:hypothetical protein [Candidatus Desulfolinea nitratireducens]